MTNTLRYRTLPATPIIAPQRFSTLTWVEVRKMVSTRSGLAVLGATLAIAVAGITWKLFHTPSGPVSWTDYSAVLPVVGMALAVIGLLGMTAEWTQRTALTTFTLSPRRGRVLTAKFLASISLAMATLLVVYALLIGGVAAGGLISGHGSDFAGLGRGVVNFLVIAALQVTMAAGFGALTAQTAAAVAAYFVAPTVWAAVGPAVLQANAQWLDVFSAFSRLSSSHPSAGLPQSLTAIAFWIVLPTAVGVVRSLQREVK